MTAEQAQNRRPRPRDPNRERRRREVSTDPEVGKSASGPPERCLARSDRDTARRLRGAGDRRDQTQEADPGRLMPVLSAPLPPQSRSAGGPNCPSASRMSFPDVPTTSALWRPWWPATEVERQTTAGAADSQGCLSLGLITEDPLGAAPETTQLPFPGSSGGPEGALQQPGKEHGGVSFGTRWTREHRAGVSRKLLCVKKQRKETGWGAGRGPVCHVNQAGSQVQVGARWWAPDPAPTPPAHPWPSPPSSSSRG